MNLLAKEEYALILIDAAWIVNKGLAKIQYQSCIKTC
jgi:hypothetical protein